MKSQFWKTPEGNPSGGQISDSNFTIVWQRGPLTEGRNGAFLIEVLKACSDWLDGLNSGSPPYSIGIGFAIVFEISGTKTGLETGLESRFTLSRVLEACGEFLKNANTMFPCSENAAALKYLELSVTLLEKQPYWDGDLRIVRSWLGSSTSALEQRKKRREIEGVLGTHEAGSDRIKHPSYGGIALLGGAI